MRVVAITTLLSALASLSVAQQPTWTLSSRAAILGDGPDEEFQTVQFGRLLPNGGAVVTDVKGLFTRVYDPSGALSATIGRNGSGPGEFRSIMGLWLTREGDIGVWDGSIRRMTTFTTAGRVVSTQNVEQGHPIAGNLEIFLGALGNGDVLLAALRAQRPATGVLPETWTMGRFAANGEFRAPAGVVRGMWRMNRGPIPFTPVPRFALRGDSIWVAEGYDPEIKVLSVDGRVARRIPLQWTTRPARDPWTALKAKLEQSNNQFYLQLLEEAPRTNEYPRTSGLLVDDRNQVWVKEYDPLLDHLWLNGNALMVTPGGRWRVLSADGRWIASVRLPANFVPLDIRGDRVLGVERDEFDVESVVVRGIVR